MSKRKVDMSARRSEMLAALWCLVIIAVVIVILMLAADKVVIDIKSETPYVPTEQLYTDARIHLDDEIYDKVSESIRNGDTITYMVNSQLHITFLNADTGKEFPRFPTIIYKHTDDGWVYHMVVYSYLEDGSIISK